MAEEKVDAKIEPKEEESIDTKMDKILDEHEASSTSKKGAEETKGKEPGVDQEKKATLDKETETPSSPEEKLAKISEILGDDKEAIDAYIKSKGYHTDPAWQKLLAKSKTGAIDEATQKSLDEFKKVTSSREYIETKMKSEGYKQEAIDAELKKRGFEVESKSEDDVTLVLNTLGLDPKGVDDNTRATISDVAKVVDIILKDRLGKTLPDTLKPLQDGLMEISRKDNASKIAQRMKGIITTEGVLDFDKDISPKIAEWLGKNPEALQEDVFDYFLELNHSLSIERLKTGKKRADNQETKNNLRSEKKPSYTLEKPVKKTGDFDTDADAVLDALGVQ